MRQNKSLLWQSLSNGITARSNICQQTSYTITLLKGKIELFIENKAKQRGMRFDFATMAEAVVCANHQELMQH